MVALQPAAGHFKTSLGAVKLIQHHLIQIIQSQSQSLGTQGKNGKMPNLLVKSLGAVPCSMVFQKLLTKTR